MGKSLGPRPFFVPLALGVATLEMVAGCGTGGGDTTETGQETSAADSGESTSPGTSSSTDPSTSSPSTTAVDTGATSEATSETSAEASSEASSDGSDSGGQVVNCADYPDEDSCVAVEICHWTPPGYCDVTCDAITEEAACSEQLACVWIGETCEYGGI